MHVVIIGAGLMGITTAYYLCRHGVEVTVLDKEPGPALGASYGNGGLLQTSAPEPWNMPGIFSVFAQAWLASLTGRGESAAFVTRTLALPGLLGWGLKFLRYANRSDYLGHTVKNLRLSNYTRDALRELNSTESLDYARAENGSIFLFRDQASMAAYVDLAEHVAKHGSRYVALGRDDLLEREPSLSDIGEQLVGGVYYPADSAGNSRQFCEQMSQILAAKGAEFRYGRDVSRLSQQGDAWSVSAGHDNLVADAVVLCAGAHSTRLARSIGIRLPIAPAKGYSISIPMRDWGNRPRHVLADMGVHAGANPMGDILRVAGTAEFAGMRDGVSSERIDYLIGLTRQIFPQFAGTIRHDEIDPWSGLRPLSADGLPFIGRTHMQKIFINSGHGGLGWTQAAGSGKALADHIVGARNGFDLTDFSPVRFH